MNIIADKLESAAVIALLEGHLADMYTTSPPESVHALDISKLKAAEIRFWTAWQNDTLLGCVALKQHRADMGEIKSMIRTNTFRHFAKRVQSLNEVNNVNKENPQNTYR
jgi:putative acetyltransferase